MNNRESLGYAGGNGGSPGETGNGIAAGTGGTNSTPGVEGADTAGNGGNGGESQDKGANGGGGGGQLGGGGGGDQDEGASGGGGANFVSSLVTNATQGTALDPGDGIVSLVPIPLVPLSLSTGTIPPTVILGNNQSFRDTATLTGGSAPTGTITFQLFAPNDPTFSNPVQTSTVPVIGDGTYSSPPFLPPQAGVYSYLVSYSGDTFNPPIALPVNPQETVSVQKHPVRLCVKARVCHATVCKTASTKAKATLQQGINPTGTMTFTLLRGRRQIALQVRPVVSNGSIESSRVRLKYPGRYRWRVVYSGDAQNAPQSAVSKCFRIEGGFFDVCC